MNIVIRDLSNNNENIETVWFPCDEEILNKICDSLGIEMTTEPNTYILDSSDKEFLKILPNNLCNIDELNYLMKRLDGFSAKETKQFYAITFAENPKTMTELINLSFNMHCYSLVTDFSDFNKVGKDLYLSERQLVAASFMVRPNSFSNSSNISSPPLFNFIVCIWDWERTHIDG